MSGIKSLKCKRGHLLSETRKTHPNGDSYCTACRLIRSRESKYVRSEKQMEYYRTKARERCRNIRKNVIDKMGGVCVICGFSDYRALQIDHINGGGSKERRENKNIVSRGMYLETVLADNGEKFQLLCANCNWIKRFENNENPKRRS